MAASIEATKAKQVPLLFIFILVGHIMYVDTGKNPCRARRAVAACGRRHGEAGTSCCRGLFSSSLWMQMKTITEPDDEAATFAEIAKATSMVRENFASSKLVTVMALRETQSLLNWVRSRRPLPTQMAIAFQPLDAK